MAPRANFDLRGAFSLSSYENVVATTVTPQILLDIKLVITFQEWLTTFYSNAPNI